MGFDVVIMPSLAQVEWWRKRTADASSSGLFSQVVTTFDAWVADLWELHGDGRLPVDGVQREMLMRAAAEALAAEGGVGALDKATMLAFAPAAAKCVRLASGLEELEQVIEAVRNGLGADRFSERERAFALLIARYGELLRAHGFIELGAAAIALSRKGDELFPRGVRVFMPMTTPLTWVQERFFDLCGKAKLVVQKADDECVGQAPPGVDVRFGCPSGALAQPGLVADIIEEYAGGESVVVTCRDPLGLFDRVSARLGGKRQLRVQARKPFAETDFGRAFLACTQCVRDDSWDPAVLADVLFGPFAGVSRMRAIEIDTSLRGDRMARREDVLQVLRAESEPFSQLEELASDPDADVLIGAFEQRMQADSRHGDSWRAEQLAALARLQRTMAAARMAGVGMEACVASLERASVPVAVCSQVPDGADDKVGGPVFMGTQPVAAQLEPGSFDVAVVADLTSESYPVADKDDAVATFFSKLGLEVPDSALGRARREFNALLGLPRKVLALVRPLGDVNADATYPAVVLEEFIDAYRADPSQTDDIRNEYRLPASLQVGLAERGEELLFANARACAPTRAQGVAGEVSVPGIADLAPGDESRVMTRRFDSQGNAIQGACPSPSQIETYLECPFRWFAERRLHTGSVDEGFGPIERGTFAHAVLQEFYLRFQAAGYSKVNEGNLDEARELMRAVADEMAQRQCQKAPGERLVATTELERREVEALCGQLVDYLDFEASFLPTFHPRYFEYEIDADHAVDYAGYSLVGKVDRIDVDDAGHAVVIDYKGSVGPEHEIAGKDWGHAGKVQTRIYARAVERALGLDVVGAFYVSYGARPQASGAYDPRILEAAHLPGMRHEHCECGLLEMAPAADDQAADGYSLADLTFSRMLDETETIAGQAISAMVAGEIEPRPASSDACRYCKVLACQNRGV